MHPTLLPTLILAAALVACAPPGGAPPEGATEAETSPRRRANGTGVQTFLDQYNSRYVELYTAAQEAEWASNTHIKEGDDTNSQRTEATAQALSEHVGSVAVIEKTRALLESKESLPDLQVRQLEKILYKAANYPQTVPDVVERRIAAETAQVEDLYGYDFQLDGASLSANEIDTLLIESRNLEERRKVWEASKEVGASVKEGLVELVGLRNAAVRSLGFDDFFAYQVSEYGMTADEMIELNQSFVRQLWPLYRQLHTWTRYELAERYGAEVPELLPAHWLPNRWGQDWSELVTVEGIDLDGALAGKEAEWVVRQAEEFYVSLGFDPLPASFYEKSSLYPLPANADYKKNNHASAWHMDFGDDVRSLMSVEPNQRWWQTTHHELGHIYYYMSYTRPEVPVLLRAGANRGFHEAVGTLLETASTQKPFLVAKRLIAGGGETDRTQVLLKEALNAVVFFPFSAGTMTHFERDLYAGLPADQYNQRWWEYVRRFQGIEPPAQRGEEYCDAASKTHISDDPGQYYDYAISQIMLYQMHAHIAAKILGQDPHDANYLGSRDIGAFLEGILELGATRDWRAVMDEHLGGELSAASILEYFAPLTEFLEKENAGRDHSLPEAPPV